MIIIAIISGTILAGIAYLLFVPIFIEANYLIGGKGRITVAFFPFRIRLKPGKKKAKTKSKPDRETLERQQLKKKKRKQAGFDFKDLFRTEYPTIKRVVVVAAKLIMGLVKVPNYRLRIELAGGLSEPDETGYLYGLVCSLRPILGRSIKLDYRPDFQGEELTGEIKGRVKIRIGSMAKELLLFLHRLPKLKLIKIYLKTRKGGKDGRQTDRPGVIHYERA
jgi:hypothetical protein